MEQEYGQTGQLIPSGTHEMVDAIDGQDIVVSIDIELQRQVEEPLTSLQGLNATGGSAVMSWTAPLARSTLPHPFRCSILPIERGHEGAMQLKAVTDLFEPAPSSSRLGNGHPGTGTLDARFRAFLPGFDHRGRLYHLGRPRARATPRLAAPDPRPVLQRRHLACHREERAISGDVQGTKPLQPVNGYNLHSRRPAWIIWRRRRAPTCSACLALRPVVGGPGVQRLVRPGLSVTPLQMTRFYGAIVNDGVECVPHFLIGMPQSGTTPDYGSHREHRCPSTTCSRCSKTVVTDGTQRRYRRIQRDGQDLHGRDLRRGERRLPQERCTTWRSRAFGGFVKQAGVLCGRK